MLISIKDLSKIYKVRDGESIHALKDINFSVKEGEFITVVGPSGCGKTTLLKILAGTLARTNGAVTIRDKHVDGPSKDIGIVFQSPVLLPWRTVLKNVTLPSEIQKLDEKIYMRRAREFLELVGLKGFENNYPGEMSGGMQQRVGICRALVHDPALLLMDEPFGALDAMTREQMNLELLRIWSESKKTAILVTHSVPEAVFLADRVIVMSPRPGRISEIFDIDIPRPRTLQMVNTKKFGGYADKIRTYFDAKARID